MDRRIFREVSSMLSSVQTGVLNLIARAVVKNVDDGRKLQLLQLGVLAGEEVGDAEHFQPHGFSSVPLVGAEAVPIFPGGDRSHPLVVVVSDRRYRPTGKPAGHVSIYHHTGAIVEFSEDGDIVLTPAPGRSILGGSAAAADKAALQSELLALRNYVAGHVHSGGTGGGGLTGGPSGTPPPTPVGATKVKVE